MLDLHELMNMRDVFYFTGLVFAFAGVVGFLLLCWGVLFPGEIE